MAYDLGSVVQLAVNLTDANNTPVDPAVGPVVTISLPDGTTATPTPLHVSTGSWTASYVTTQPGRHAVNWVGTGLNGFGYTDVFDVEAVIQEAIVSLGDAKRQINIPASNTQFDDELRLYIRSASDVVNVQCGISTSATFTETVSPTLPDYTGRQRFCMSHIPLISVQSITPLFPGQSALVLKNMDVDAPAGIIWLPDTATFTACTVVYTAGRAIVPATLQLATLMIVQHLWQTQRGGAVAVPGMGAEDASVIPGYGFTIPNRALELMNGGSDYAAPGFG